MYCGIRVLSPKMKQNQCYFDINRAGMAFGFSHVQFETGFLREVYLVSSRRKLV